MYALGRVSMPLFAFDLGYNLARPGMLASGGYQESGTNRGLGIIKQPSAQEPKLLSHHVQPQKGAS